MSHVGNCSLQTLGPTYIRNFLTAEFISQKMYSFSFIRGHFIPRSLNCTHSVTKITDCRI